MPGLEGLGSLREEALPEYLGCCYLSFYHHHQGDVEISPESTQAPVPTSPWEGAWWVGKNPLWLWGVKMH